MSDRERVRRESLVPAGSGADATERQARGVARWLDPGLLVLAVVLAFWPALAAGFVWDDRFNLLENEAFVGDELLSWAWSSFHGGHYQPLTWMSLALDKRLWGLAPVGYHLTNLLLHALNAVLVLLLFRRLLARAWEDGAVSAGARRWGALLAAAVFALHPMRVESVAWITERRDVLSTAFLLGSVLAWLTAVECGPGRGRRWLALSLLAYVLSLLSKASGMSLAAVLLVLDWQPLARSRQGPGRAAESGRALLLEKLPYAVLGALTAAVALTAQASSGALVGLAVHGWIERAAQTAYSLAYYPWALFGKLSWSPLYERPFRIDASEARFVLAAVAVLAVSVAAWRWRRRLPALVAAWITYVVLLLPVAGVAQSGVQLVADRYGYLPCLGLLLLGGAAFAQGWDRRPRARPALAALALAVVGLWSLLTFRLTTIWQDDERLWRHALEFGPSAMAHHNLGLLASDEIDGEAALTHLVRALELMPTYDKPLAGLSALLEPTDTGLAGEALATAEAAVAGALALRPNDPQALFVAASLALQRALRAGSDRELVLGRADAQLARSLELDPGRAAAWYKRGLVLLQLRRLEEAERHLEQALALAPGHGEAWLTAGIVQLEREDWERAAAAFERAVELLPERSLAWTGRGAVRRNAGDVEGARADLQRALELDGDNARARALLASLPAGTGG